MAHKSKTIFKNILHIKNTFNHVEGDLKKMANRLGSL